MIMRLVSPLLAVASLTAIAHGDQLGSWAPLSPRTANYTLAVALDTASKTLHGSETLVWHNPSGDVIKELQFHLYLNAFQDGSSTFMRKSGISRPTTREGEENSGWIRITSIRSSDGQDLRGGMEFIQPDDGNTHDHTVIRVPLHAPVSPRGTITLQLEFDAKLPEVIRRTGYFGEFYLVGQWFPKIGVYEAAGVRGASRGRWNCHQFHAETEFYADFGIYDVTITLPAGYVVGATGIQRSERRNPDGTRSVTYRAEDVHDFAWTASPEFADLREQWRGVTIRLLLSPNHSGNAHRYFQSARASLAYLDAHVGPYPYPMITIVDPPRGASASGGMEYPTLITGDIIPDVGEWLRSTEDVTVHELVHQYWQGMVANNEVEEPWLDEGVTQYYEWRIMDETYGAQTSFVNLGCVRIGNGEYTRAGYVGMRNPRIAPITTPGWKLPSSAYGRLSYHKTATVLMTLDRLAGRAAMDSAMRTYFRRWQFRHPSGGDFIQAFNDVIPTLPGNQLGSTLDWFFDQLLHGTGICDYELTSIQNDVDDHPEEAEGRTTAIPPPNDSAEQLHTAVSSSKVVISRLGDVMLPVEVLVRFENGQEICERWDGRTGTVEFRYRMPSRIVSAIVDPERKICVDRNIINNSKTLTPSGVSTWSFALRVLFWIQNIMQTLLL